MMRQYLQMKQQHQNAILLFRMGDFYEMFHEDAKIASRVLGLTLTSRDKGSDPIPMAGVPHHAVDGYIRRLIAAGHKVAVCDQIQDPREAKGLVERDITRVITPGTLTDESLLDANRSNYLAAVFPDGKVAGIAWVELSTGEFFVQDVDPGRVVDEIARIRPAELLVPETASGEEPPAVEQLRQALDVYVTPRPDWSFDRATAMRALMDHFKVSTLAGFGCGDLNPAVCAAGAVLQYLGETHRTSLQHISSMRRLGTEGFVLLNESTQRSLELLETMRSHERLGSLLWVLDKTVTPMAARLLQQWICYPLASAGAIIRRQAGVAELHDSGPLRDDVRETLDGIRDIERIATRISCGRASPRDLVALRFSAERLPKLRELLASAEAAILEDVRVHLDDLADIAELIESSIVDEPPVPTREGGIIRDGYNGELDEMRSIRRDGRQWIARFQADLIARTGIQSLKVGFNRVFGYYIEVSHANAGRMPPEFTRRQTLKNAERYITPELKEYEDKVLNAEERANGLEYDIFCSIRDEIATHTDRIQKVAAAVAQLDLLATLAQVAVDNRYCRPEIDDSLDLTIIDGRHPVLELIQTDEPFVPNNAEFEAGKLRIMIVTGPNMAGKSTYIRQVALIVLMAQMGGFVPAKSARIGAVDRIFTRVGASDELSRGQSTFMVEMIEAANILNNATERSLLVLDEVGRGTSTFDGVSIAWSVTEYIHEHIKARTLFATHYHELTELSTILDGVKNYNIAVREWGDEIIFLRKILPGGTDKSYGIHVARLAGVPPEVIERAKSILSRLEADSINIAGAGPKKIKAKKPRQMQLALFGSLHEETIDKLKSLRVEDMTPLEALMKLEELREEVRRREK